jgi:hypothetical protein
LVELPELCVFAAGEESTTDVAPGAPWSALRLESTARGAAKATPPSTSAVASRLIGPLPIRVAKCLIAATASMSEPDDGIREASGMKTVWAGQRSLAGGTVRPERGTSSADRRIRY